MGYTGFGPKCCCSVPDLILRLDRVLNTLCALQTRGNLESFSGVPAFRGRPQNEAG